MFGESTSITLVTSSEARRKQLRSTACTETRNQQLTCESLCTCIIIGRVIARFDCESAYLNPDGTPRKRAASALQCFRE